MTQRRRIITHLFSYAAPSAPGSKPDALLGRPSSDALCGRSVDATGLANALGPTIEQFTSERAKVTCSKCSKRLEKIG